jgi:hypothetical protein
MESSLDVGFERLTIMGGANGRFAPGISETPVAGVGRELPDATTSRLENMP